MNRMRLVGDARWALEQARAARDRRRESHARAQVTAEREQRYYLRACRQHDDALRDYLAACDRAGIAPCRDAAA